MQVDWNHYLMRARDAPGKNPKSCISGQNFRVVTNKIACRQLQCSPLDRSLRSHGTRGNSARNRVLTLSFLVRPMQMHSPGATRLVPRTHDYHARQVLKPSRAAEQKWRARRCGSSGILVSMHRGAPVVGLGAGCLVANIQTPTRRQFLRLAVIITDC
jgi:hypothetical protein